MTSLFENTHIFAQIFSSETKIVIFICKLWLQTAKRVYKNQRTVNEYVNILFNPVYEKVLFFEFISEQTECVPTLLSKRSETVCKPTNERKNVRGPCCAETAVRNLPYNAVDLLKQLDIGGLNDWKTLAGHLGN